MVICLAAFTLFSGGGLLAQVSGVDAIHFGLAAYAFAAAVVISGVLGAMPERRFAPEAGRFVLWLGVAGLVYGALVGTSEFVEALASGDRFASLGEGFEPYARHIAGAAPYAAVCLVVVAALKAAEAWWMANQPASEPDTVFSTPGPLYPTLRRAGLMAAAAYVLLGEGGFLTLADQTPLSQMAAPVYVGAGGWALATITAALGRESWRYSLWNLVLGLGLAAAVYVGLSGLAEYASASPVQASWHTYAIQAGRLAPWLAALVTTAFAYRAAAIQLVTPAHPWFHSRLNVDPQAPIRLAVQGGVAAFAAFLLFNPGGLTAQWLGLDLSTFEGPAYGTIALLLLSGATDLLAVERWTRAGAVVASRLALAIVCYGLFESLPDLAGRVDQGEPTMILGAELGEYVAHTAGVGMWVAAVFMLAGMARAAQVAFHGGAGSDVTELVASPVQAVARHGLHAILVYLFLHPSGFLTLATGVNFGVLQGPAYGVIFLRLAGDMAWFFGRGGWQSAGQFAAHGAARSLLWFGLLANAGAVGEALTSAEATSGFGTWLTPYLSSLPALAPWAAAYHGIGAAYLASLPYLSRWRTLWDRTALEGREIEPVRALRRAAATALAGHLMFSPAGLMNVWFGADISFLTLPVILFALAYIVARLLPMVVTRRRAPSAATLLLGLAGALLAFSVMDGMTRVGIELSGGRYPALGDALLPYFAVVSRLAPWAAAGVFAYAVYRTGRVTFNLAETGRYQPVFKAAVAVVLGVIAWGALNAMSGLGPAYGVVGVIAFGAAAAVAVGHLLSYLTGHQDPLIADLSDWAAGSAFRNANIGGFLGAYAAIVRPALHEAMSHAQIVELAGILVLCVYLVRRTSGRVVHSVVDAGALPQWLEWSRHNQEVRVISDPHITPLVDLQRSYVFRGDGESLAVRLITAMWDDRLPLDGISRAIEPLVGDPAEAPQARARRILYRLPGGSGRHAADIEQGRAEAHQRVREAMDALMRERSWRTDDTGLRAEDWRIAREEFEETGNVTALAALTSVSMWQEGQDRAAIAAALRPLWTYRDRPIRWYQAPYMRHRLIADNLRRRREIASALTGGEVDATTVNAA